MNYKLKNTGFTLIEALIAVTIFAVIGIVAADLLNRSFQGNNKATLVSKLKQNGQSALNIMGETIRSSDAVICTGTYPDDPAYSNDTIVIVKNGVYTRFRFYLQKALSANNGYIAQDLITLTGQDSQVLCSATQIPMSTNQSYLTDTDINNGISIKSGVFDYVKKDGVKDLVTIKFSISQGVNAIKGVDTQTNDVSFETTVTLR
ncbi:prepilin-type N-terminal cleavage/methylation domain-containing protein [Candidatus Daviesbacteria bacterium]|nr:prepilin-type N-terminal cleavage/methylation domain-containing protein [Candidatus Daviesbacteria bacterium]